jgi:hypothetical protein
MSTPLATILAAMNEMNSLISEYKDSVGHPDVLPEDHMEIADEM